VRCQLLASEFYEALKRALRAPELSPVERCAVMGAAINVFMPRMQASVRVLWCSSSEPLLQCCSSMGPHHRKEAAAQLKKRLSSRFAARAQ
jgi:hypothetical protein